MAVLDGLVQAIHIPSAPSDKGRFLLYVAASDESSETTMMLYAHSSGQAFAWMGKYKITEESIAESMAEAIRAGHLHLDLKGKKTLSDLDYLSARQGIKTIDATEVELTDTDYCRLMDASLDLLSRPKAATPPPARKTRSSADEEAERKLRAELSEREAELQHLSSRLNSMKATIARSQDVEGKKRSQPSPQKKPPANASALQPNQKRRKVVEDEFAGSDEEDADDSEE